MLNNEYYKLKHIKNSTTIKLLLLVVLFIICMVLTVKPLIQNTEKKMHSASYASKSHRSKRKNQLTPNTKMELKILKKRSSIERSLSFIKKYNRDVVRKDKKILIDHILQRLAFLFFDV
jgi:hypothetical protein